MSRRDTARLLLKGQERGLQQWGRKARLRGAGKAVAMPVDLLLLGAALLTGLLGGVHCAAMCGGIATSVSLVQNGRGPWPALQTNLGRITGYAVAGALAGGLGGGVLGIARSPVLGSGLRVLAGAVLVLIALYLFDRRGRFGFLSRPAQWLWRALRPLQRHLLPADTVPRRVALGMLWGWLPCGLSVTVLATAWLQANALGGAAIMSAFGLGTLAVMWPLTWSGQRLTGWIERRGLRGTGAGLVLLAGLFTIAVPWLMQVPAMHGLLGALGCTHSP